MLNDFVIGRLGSLKNTQPDRLYVYNSLFPRQPAIREFSCKLKVRFPSR